MRARRNLRKRKFGREFTKEESGDQKKNERARARDIEFVRERTESV